MLLRSAKQLANIPADSRSGAIITLRPTLEDIFSLNGPQEVQVVVTPTEGARHCRPETLLRSRFHDKSPPAEGKQPSLSAFGDAEMRKRAPLEPCMIPG